MNTIQPDVRHRLLDQLAMVPACQTCNGGTDWFPSVDIWEDADQYLFKIDLPDVSPEDVRIVIERDGLVISGDRPKPEQPGKTCLRIERPHGYFERRFALPDDASRTEVEPSFTSSVLELHVHKLTPVPQSSILEDKVAGLRQIPAPIDGAPKLKLRPVS